LMPGLASGTRLGVGPGPAVLRRPAAELVASASGMGGPT